MRIMTLASIHACRREAPRRHAVAGRILICIFALVTGCGEEPTTVAEPKPSNEAGLASHDISWLAVDNDLSPSQWLASRNEPTLRPSGDPEVQRVKRLLDEAHRLYRESQRMIANRTVQLETMLATNGQNDKAVQILQDLSEVPGEVGQTEGYGAIGQHYVNLRGEGRSREDALAELKRLYGKRRPQ
jgi:hypothetical protein